MDEDIVVSLVLQHPDRSILESVRRDEEGVLGSSEGSSWIPVHFKHAHFMSGGRITGSNGAGFIVQPVSVDEVVPQIKGTFNVIFVVLPEQNVDMVRVDLSVITRLVFSSQQVWEVALHDFPVVVVVVTSGTGHQKSG